MPSRVRWVKAEASNLKERTRRSFAAASRVRHEYGEMQLYTNAPALGKPHDHTPFGNWETDPWPESVTTAPLLDLIVDLLSKHLVLRPHERIAIALWILHAWAHDAAQQSPLLAIVSPQRRCGKTTLLDLLHPLVPRPLPASNLTVPVLYRSVDKWQPTLLIDEADTFLTGRDDLRGVLDSGHSRTSAIVLRCSGNSHEPRAYKTWAPKVIALIGQLPDTLADRAIIISMQRKRLGEKIAHLRDSAVIFAKFNRMAARWATDHVDVLRSADPDIPQKLNDRAGDNWRPLLAIADLADGNWPSLARAAAVPLSGSTDDDPLPIQLLADIRSIFQENAIDRLSSKDLVELLVGEPDRPWAEYRHGKPITQRQIAVLLRPFGIMPRTIRVGEDTPKGYHCEDFEDAYDRYLGD